MDPVFETQMSFNNLLHNDFDYPGDAHWVKIVWRREDTSDFY